MPIVICMGFGKPRCNPECSAKNGRARLFAVPAHLYSRKGRTVPFFMLRSVSSFPQPLPARDPKDIGRPEPIAPPLPGSLGDMARSAHGTGTFFGKQSGRALCFETVTAPGRRRSGNAYGDGNFVRREKLDRTNCPAAGGTHEGGDGKSPPRDRENPRRDRLFSRTR